MDDQDSKGPHRKDRSDSAQREGTPVEGTRDEGVSPDEESRDNAKGRRGWMQYAFRLISLSLVIVVMGSVATYLIISGSLGSGGGDSQPTPEGIPSDLVLIAIAAQDIPRGSQVSEDGFIVTRMPANMVVETMISGPDEEGIKSRLVGYYARQDIYRGVPITEGMLSEHPIPLSTPDVRIWTLVGEIYDEFSEPSSGWEMFDEPDLGRAEYLVGMYMLTSFNPDTTVQGILPVQTDDLAIDVSARILSNPDTFKPAYGVVCRSWGSDGYFFLITPDGQYSIQKSVGGVKVPLVDWTDSEAINEGYSENLLGVVCDQSELSLTVNDELLAEVVDETFSEGNIGLVGKTFEEGGALFAFDDFAAAPR